MKISFYAFITSVFISCVYSQYEQYPPTFADPDPSIPRVPEGNYTENPKKVFTIRASVRSTHLTVDISKGESDTSDLISLNCTHNNSRVTCFVYLTADVDRERTQSLEFFFIAKSSNTNAQTSTKSVTLILEDVNDESPVFDSPSYQILLPENYAVNSMVSGVNIHATDPDTGLAGLVSYSLKPSGQAANLYTGYFKIDPGSGNLTLIKQLDYEELTFLQYIVIAADHNNTHTSTAELLVKVEDVQDKPPTFIGVPYLKTFPENYYGEILKVEAIDGDLGIPRNVYYGNLTGSCAEYLTINETGFITVANGKILDRDSVDIAEARGVCFIKIEAYEDEMSKTNLTRSFTDFALTIEDLNDNAPKFTNAVYNGSVEEEATISISFEENIHVEDKDQNKHNDIKLSVYYPNMTIYDGMEVTPSEIIGKGIVLLRVKTPFDYETHDFVHLKLMAEDKENISLNSICDVYITINDANDNDPEFTATNYKFNVSENSCNGSYVGTINATDKDSGPFGKVTYQFSGSNSRFAIDENSGQIFVATDKGCNCTGSECDDSDLNWEKNQIYFLTAVAQDGGGKRSPVSVEIHLADVNDNAPQFQYSSYETSIKENSTVFSSGKQHFIVQATDGDDMNSNNSKISYCIVDDNNTCINHSYFHINKSGVITCIKKLDYENLPVSSETKDGMLIVRISAFDYGVPSLTSTATLIITVQDENDNNPTFNQVYKGYVEENSGFGTPVLKVSATDNDGTAPNNEISYFIFSGGSDQFRMDGSSGVISVQFGANLDRESVPQYEITVIAIDRGNPQRNGTTNVTVNILDINDTPPKFLNIPSEQNVPENDTGTLSIFNISCEDEDSNSELEFSIKIEEVVLVDGSKANESELIQFKDYFFIDKSAGLLYSSQNVDAEIVSQVVLNVKVVDINTTSPYENSSMAQLKLIIKDKNDNPPYFLAKSLSAGILRNSAFNTTVYDLKERVYDADSSVENRIHAYYMDTIRKDLHDDYVGQGCRDEFCVTRNGTVFSNVLFAGKGFAKFNVSVSDIAGHDYTVLNIYVIDESQQLSMHFLMRTNAVYQVKDTVLRKLSEVLGYKCVFDKIEQYQDDNGNLKEHESLLTFHVLDEPTDTVLEAVYVESLLDKSGDNLKEIRDEFAVNSIGALQIKDTKATDNKIKETYILVAVIALLTLILGIIIYFYIVSSSRFKRKLKAATISTKEKNNESLGPQFIPGSNQFSTTKNPLIDQDEEVKRVMNDPDRVSLAGSENSLDANEVEFAKRNHDNDNPVEEKEVIMDMYGDDHVVIPNDTEDNLMLLKQAVEQHEQTAIFHNRDDTNQFDGMNGKNNNGYVITECTDV